MTLTITGLLSAAQIADFRQALGSVEWIDGIATGRVPLQPYQEQ